MHIGRAWKVGLAACVAAPVLVWVGLAIWLPSDAELARRVAQAAAQRLGVGVSVGTLQWHVWPEPSVVLENVATDQERPLQLTRLTLAPQVLPLLTGQLVLQRVELEGGVIAQRSLRSLGLAAGSAPNTDTAAASRAEPTKVEVQQVAFRDLTWISRTGVAVVYEGHADFDPGWRLRNAVLRRPGVQPATDLTITSAPAQGAEPGLTQERFTLRGRTGGGTAEGQAVLQHHDDGSLQLTGQLAPRNIEVFSGLAAFNRRSPLSGRVSGQTSLQARGPNAFALAQTLHTETEFTMQPAKLLRFDLDRAVRTLGREHKGETVLDQLTGRVDTQNTPDGMLVRFIDLKAKSGALTASGNATLKNRQVQATAAVDLIDGLVGIPVRVEGTLGALKVSVPGGAVAGAVAGTAVLPGIGTVIGAALGRIFGSDAPPDKPKPRADVKAGEQPAPKAR